MTTAPPGDTGEREERVLILAPLGRDARLAAETLGRVPLRCHVCADLSELRREIAAGAGVVLVTDEVFREEAAADPDDWVGPEPPWSQLPFVVLTDARTRSRPRLAALRRLERRRNASFLARPVPRLTLVSAVRAALESRRRQYMVRDLLEEFEAGVRQRDEFLAMLGHELRNPMAAIANGLALLREDAAPLGGTARFATELMERQVGHLSRILDDLLDVSRITRGKLELRRGDVELGAAVRSIADGFRLQLEERGQTLALSLPEEPVWTVADATRLEQILWNLLSNATKYTERGGHLRVSLAADGGIALVRVADDGRGMTREFLRRAFEIFAQADAGKGGLGLGLALSRRLAELHGGSLTATSPGLGQGSEFALCLPLGEPPARPAPAETASPDAPPRRVLLVEDHEDLAWGLERVLQALGHDVRRVATGREALALAADYRPEVVLLDIGLPDMDGAEVARHLRAELGSAALLAAMSGFGQEEVRRRSLHCGCDRYLTKPVAQADLQALLSEIGGPAT